MNNNQYRRRKNTKRRKSNKYRKLKKQSRKLTRINSRRSSRNKKLKRRSRTKKQLYGGGRFKVDDKVKRNDTEVIGTIRKINEDGLVITWVNDEECTYDPTTKTDDNGEEYTITPLSGYATEPEPEPE